MTTDAGAAERRAAIAAQYAGETTFRVSDLPVPSPQREPERTIHEQRRDATESKAERRKRKPRERTQRSRERKKAAEQALRAEQAVEVERERVVEQATPAYEPAPVR